MTEGLDSSRQEHFSQVVADYLEAVKLGHPPERASLLQQFPELADELREFFADHDRMNKFAQPLRPTHHASVPQEPVAPTLNHAASGDQANSEHMAGTLSNDSRSEAAIRGQSAPPVGTRVRYFGDYELLDEVACGGMGVVYKARQVKLNRVVALKMILTGQFASREDVQRFYTEAEAAANLDHQGIVPIFEVGEFEGQHYLSMGFVDGESLATKLIEGPLPPREAAELVQTVAQAVQFAHEHGVIHRDLKPSNILLDAQKHPRITDFGLAKRVQSDSHLTETGQILGTPSFMPPEQAAGRLDQVRETSDVYALGAVLYTSLTGHPPFHADNPLDTLLQVMEREPISPHELNQNVPRDLETICLKCLEKDRRRRYRSASELADELNRYLDGRPIQARPIGRAARVWRWCRRNPAVASLTTAVVLSLLLGTVVSTSFALLSFESARREKIARGLADQSAIAARDNERRALENEVRAKRNAAKEATARRQAELQRQAAKEAQQQEARQREIAKHQRVLAEERELTARRNLYVAHMTLAQRAWERGDGSAVLDLLNRQRPQPNQHDFRGFGWHYLWNHCHRSRVIIESEAGSVLSVEFSPDGATLVTGNDDGSVKLWNIETGELHREFRGHTDAVNETAFSPDGRLMVSAGDDSNVILWDVASGRRTATLTGHKGHVRAVAFSPDGQTLATGGFDRIVKLWDVATGNVLTRLEGHAGELNTLVFSPDGTKLASACDDHTARIWDVTSGQLRATLQGHTDHVTDAAFSADGETLATSSRDTLVKFWDVAAARERHTSLANDWAVWSCSVSRDGEFLISGGRNNSLAVWDVSAGRQTAMLLGHTKHISSTAVSPDGTLLATGSYDASARLWDLKSIKRRLILRGHTGTVWTVAFSPDGQTLATGGDDKTVRLWDRATGEETTSLTGHHSGVHSVAFSPNGKLLASGSSDRTIRLWNRATDRVQSVLKGHRSGVKCTAFSPDGQTLASCSDDRTARLWDVSTGNELAVLTGHTAQVDRLAFSPDGRTLATTSRDGTVRLWNVSTENEEAQLHGLQAVVWGLAFSPDGKTLATVSVDTTLRLWDLATCRERATFRGHTAKTNVVVFSPDGTMLASGGNDTTARLWDVETGLEHVTFTEHTHALRSVAISPDGKTLATAGGDSTVRLWGVWDD